ncbi:MAG: virulence factor Mce family protein [Marmoricola sp.]|nr:virulence factor Mce family protein [Marmoricola sp.]
MKGFFSQRFRALAVIGCIVGALTLSSCSIYDVQLPGGPNVGSNPIKVHILFRDVLDLVPQSTVKVDDVTVGKVTKINLKGYVADVTVELPNTVDLPANAKAEIRQTSLLGEKFVSLSKPATPVGQLRTGDVIGLDNSGRNPEIEEVFGALALLLNGGGVGQLKTIADQLNLAFGGREPEVRSILTQLRSFASQLDANKGSIVTALQNVDNLAAELRRQDGTIKSALDNLPAAIASVNGQRKDLVNVLQALARLSSVGVRVIEASKATTINTLDNLAPILAALGRAGQDFPKSLQVALTYPFIDEAVGRSPVVARNLHMGDFTNLSVNLSLDLLNLPSIPGLAPGVSLADLLSTCSKSPLGAVCDSLKGLLSGTQLQQLCGLIAALCNATKGNGGGGLPIPGIGNVTGTILQPGNGATTPSNQLGALLGGLFGGLGRTAPGAAYDPRAPQDPFLLTGTGYDPGVGTLLLQGVAVK